MRQKAHGAAVGILILLALAAGSMIEPTAAIDPSAFWGFEAVSDTKPKLDIHYVPTPPAVVDAMLKLADLDSGDLLYDLGSGDGRIVIAGAKQYGARGVGVDLDPERIRESVDNAKKAGVTDRVRFIQGNLFDADLRQATAVTLYLYSDVNLKLRPKLLRELRPGTPVVSHSFDMGDWRPDRMVEVQGRTVYLWIVPAKVEGRWEVSVEGKEVPAPAELLLEQKYQRVKGSASFAGEPVPVKSVRLSGDTLEFRVGPRNGDTTPALLFRGRVKGDSIEGRVIREGDRPAEARWTAVKAPALRTEAGVGLQPDP